jgi:hypothetical protein
MMNSKRAQGSETIKFQKPREKKTILKVSRAERKRTSILKKKRERLKMGSLFSAAVLLC